MAPFSDFIIDQGADEGRVALRRVLLSFHSRGRGCDKPARRFLASLKQERPAYEAASTDILLVYDFATGRYLLFLYAAFCFRAYLSQVALHC